VLERIRRYHSTSDYKAAPGWKINDPEKPVFLSVHGTALSVGSVYKSIKSAWKRINGVQGKVSPHSLRHTTAYSMLQSEMGEDLHDKLLIIKGMFGHNSIRTTEIYCSIPLAVMESINSRREVRVRYQEAEQIYQFTYLPMSKNTERRGHCR
jgi:integrase/recombinase XerD